MERTTRIGRTVCTLILLLLAVNVSAVTYTKADSAKVVRLLEEGRKQREGTNLILFYANKLKGLPYVAATLEVNKSEELVVNLRQMDCATLVDNSLALTLTTRQKSVSFKDFCYWLERIRYREGKLDGYASRNHYFSQWVNSNTKLGLVEEIQEGAPFKATKKTDLHFMSQHSDKYPMLVSGGEKTIKLIRKYEEEVNGNDISYIPHSMLNKSRRELSCVQDGNILALVTKKDGLDVSHLGIAVWGKDGKLHLLNASSIHHKVVLESMTLYQYMAKHPSQLGIRVVRIK